MGDDWRGGVLVETTHDLGVNRYSQTAEAALAAFMIFPRLGWWMGVWDEPI